MQKFTQMRVQLQAVSLRMQTLRSNESMAQAMRGATRAMGQMNRSLNLPQIQRIMNEFEKESATMDMKEEMMSDAVDDAMEDEDEGEGEDVESDKILREVFDEIGMGMNEAVSWTRRFSTDRHSSHPRPPRTRWRTSPSNRPESRSPRAAPDRPPARPPPEAAAAARRRTTSSGDSTCCAGTSHLCRMYWDAGTGRPHGY